MQNFDHDTLLKAAQSSKAWPFEEARKIAKRYPSGKKNGEPIVFETGYGPSGLPHIGTFNEVLRTTFVQHAYEQLTGGAPTRLITFSDDMDGFRKVPTNVPGQDMLSQYIDFPLSRVPDPFGKAESFAHYNNASLKDFLDRFGFDYEFLSSSNLYCSGQFDDMLRLVMERIEAIKDVILPTLGAERQASYSPILPISGKTGKVLQVPVTVVNADEGIIRFTDEDGEEVEQSALSGQSKLQWKVDWAMRWVALDVDYEMSGKDLTESVALGGRIAKILGGKKPAGLTYELFLDAKGEKISKSKGNGLGIEEWLTYGNEESLAFYIFREPRRAKQLHMGVIPRAVDEYFQFRTNWHEQDIDKRLGNPVHHMHNGAVPAGTIPISYGLLLNLASTIGDADKEQLWGFVKQYAPDATPVRYPDLDGLIDNAIAYAQDFVAPTLHKRKPSEEEAVLLSQLDDALSLLDPDSDAQAIQSIIYALGKEAGYDPLRNWFTVLYETLLGASQGPRLGSFILLYGRENVRQLIRAALER